MHRKRAEATLPIHPQRALTQLGCSLQRLFPAVSAPFGGAIPPESRSPRSRRAEIRRGDWAAGSQHRCEKARARAVMARSVAMDTSCLEYCLTEAGREEFERNGYFVVEDVLPPKLIEELSAVVDRVDTEFRPKLGLGPHDRMNLLDFVGKDELFLELLDWP